MWCTWIRLHCISEYGYGGKFEGGTEDGRAATQVKLSTACETKEEDLRKTSPEDGEGC